MTDASLDTSLDAGVSAPAQRRETPRAAAPAQPNRIDGLGRVDRGVSWSFDWNGKRLAGHPGDTLSSALLANGVKIVGRSFKYHRPRGVMSAGVEEGGAIVSTGAGARLTPNVNASTQPLYDGLIAKGQNAWPSVDWDIGRLNDAMGRFFGAGFYYKTFFSFLPVTPKGTGHWMQFEKLIRQAAGMGRASRAPDPDAYEIAHSFCDLLVVGAGPAGIEAARVAAEAGQDVVLVDQDFALGGRLLSEAAAIEGASPEAWLTSKLGALRAAGVRLMPRTTAFGLYDGGVAGLAEQVAIGAPAAHHPRERIWILRAAKTVLATGAIERGLAFGNNDRPGVMTLGAMQTYVNRFGAAPGRKVAAAIAHDGALPAIADLRAAGLDVTVLDLRDEAPGLAGAIAGAAPLRALGANAVSGLEYARETSAGWSAHDRLDCDAIAVAGGWSPVVNLLSHRGSKPVWNAEKACFLPGATPEPIDACGAAAGVWSAEGCAASGRNAAARALGGSEEPVADQPHRLRAVYEVRVPGRPMKAFVDPQHDVTSKDIRQAHQEGYVSVEHLKRYTTLGMATDQGKNGNIIGLALMAEALGREVPAVGTTTFRPPYTPVSIGALAGRARGRHYKPERRTPMHAWHIHHGAKMTDAGLWKRSWYYPKPGESLDDAYIREATVVRQSVGLCDVTSLGKIAVQGPDAAEFLNRIYTNAFAKLPIGKARYGIMLRDDGVVFDDGTTWRMGEQDFFMTTTTAGAGKVMSWLEELLQVRWPELKVSIASVSERWAGFAVAGPEARHLLRAVAPSVDFSDDAFPFMGVREGVLASAAGAPVRCRIARLSFSGELAYEIYVESDFGHDLAEMLWTAAEPIGGVLYGTEALGALRIEKGHVAGSELDGRTTLDDLGLGGLGSKKKAYIGKQLSALPGLTDPKRQKLVGLIPVEKDAVFKAGAILCPREKVAGHGAGWVSAVTHSPALGHWIGLGLIEGGAEAWADRAVLAADPARGMETAVKVVSPHFVDPSGGRMKPAEDAAAPAGLATPSTAFERRSALGAVWRADETERRRVIGRAKDLADPETPAAQPGDASVWLVERRPVPVWRVTAWPDGLAETEALLAEIAGAAAPGPNQVTSGAAGAELLRTGPLAWRLHGAADAADRLADLSSGAALELSHSDCQLLIGGARAADLINRFAALDLRQGRFPPGAVAMTAMHHITVLVQRADDNAFALFAPRSYAQSLWELLEETAAQWRAEHRAP